MIKTYFFFPIIYYQVPVNLTRFYLDGTKILTQIGNQRLDFFYDENDSVVAFKYNNAMYYYLKNAQGDIYAIVDSTGAKVAQYTYDAWGNVLTVKDGNGVAVSESNKTHVANLNPFRYRGYYYDVDLNLYYLQSRYYDPAMGRFINADIVLQLDIIQSVNLYTYCWNSPVNYVDDTGNWPQVSTTTISSIISKSYKKFIQLIEITESLSFFATYLFIKTLVIGIIAGAVALTNAPAGFIISIVGAIYAAASYLVDKYGKDKAILFAIKVQMEAFLVKYRIYIIWPIVYFTIEDYNYKHRLLSINWSFINIK